MGKGERRGGLRGRRTNRATLRFYGGGGNRVRGLQGCGLVFIIFTFFLVLPGIGLTVSSYTTFSDDFFSSMRYIGLTFLGLAATCGVIGLLMCIVGKNQAANATEPSNTTDVVTTVAPTVVVAQNPHGHTGSTGYTAQPVGYDQYPSSGPPPAQYGQYGQANQGVPPPSYGQAVQQPYPPPSSAFNYSDPAYPPMYPPAPGGQPA